MAEELILRLPLKKSADKIRPYYWASMEKKRGEYITAAAIRNRPSPEAHLCKGADCALSAQHTVPVPRVTSGLDVHDFLFYLRYY